MIPMIDSVLEKLQPFAKRIVLVAFYTATAFELLGVISRFDNGFFGAIGGLITTAILVAFWAIIPTLFLLKKEDLAQKIFPFLLFYWLLNEIFELLSATAWIRSDVKALFVLVGICEFIIALAILAAIVLGFLGKIMKNELFSKLPYLICGGVCFFFVVDFILRVITEIKYKADWSDYLETVVFTLIVPIGILFAVLYFFPPKQAATENAPTATE